MSEGLYKIVVRTKVEPRDAVGQTVPGGEHDDGCRITPPPHRANDFETVTVGQTKIEQDDLIGRRFDGGARLLDQAGDIDGKSTLAQIRRDEIGELCLIFDEKNSHRRNRTHNRALTR
jgi:hypothetical protein